MVDEAMRLELASCFAWVILIGVSAGACSGSSTAGGAVVADAASESTTPGEDGSVQDATTQDSTTADAARADDATVDAVGTPPPDASDAGLLLSGHTPGPCGWG